MALLRDVFDRPDLFADHPRIARRFVAWGSADPVIVPHGAVVLSEQELVSALGPDAPDMSTGPADFSIHCAPPFPEGTLRAFGSRPTTATRVWLAPEADRATCWIESVENGWLFLIPAQEQAWLLAVGGASDALLGTSRHVARLIASLDEASASFETSPRILSQMQGPDWLACGSAAIAFDPICGDGTAQAMREAIMASAVIGGTRDGMDATALRTHFESMMIGAMRRHLRLCAQFYENGGQNQWWHDQLAGLAEGFDWCTARLAALPEPRFELHNLRLVARECVA
jgi:hypothetical protein